MTDAVDNPSQEASERRDQSEGEREAPADREYTRPFLNRLRSLACEVRSPRNFSVSLGAQLLEVEIGRTLLVIWTPCPARAPDRQEGIYRATSRRTLAAARPLEVGFDAETNEHRRNKELGTNRELAWGDPAFDDAVYIHSHCEDTALHELLASHNVRDAITRVVQMSPSQFVLDDARGRISVCFNLTRPLPDVADAAESLVSSLQTIVEEMPLLLSTGRRARRWTILKVGAATAAAILPGGAFVWYLWSGLVQPHVMLFLVGVALGIGLSLLAWRPIHLRVRGQFHSATKRKVWKVLAVGIGIELGLVLARVMAEYVRP